MGKKKLTQELSHKQQSKLGDTSYFFGYKDPRLHSSSRSLRLFPILFALFILFVAWFGLNQKILFGDDWISPTYDNEGWTTNEGNLHTFGAWDIETHIFKSDFIAENFPHFQWNPDWYLGMPLIKYYPPGFYFANITLSYLLDVSTARSSLFLVTFGHLAAALLTFLLCLKISRRPLVSSLCSLFVIANPFLSLRSYGWEPISVVFMFLFPLGLLLFLRQPLKPLRFWLILVVGLAYVMHPLIWFSLLMFMGIFLFLILIRKDLHSSLRSTRPLWSYFLLVVLSLLIGAVQFFPQIAYDQVTSGAHMGMKYLPFYQVQYNVLALHQFFFEASNLKGPGLIVLIALLFFVLFSWDGVLSKKKRTHSRSFSDSSRSNDLSRQAFCDLIRGIACVLFFMILFYYLELFNIFPMNVLRSIQYHRIIPEFIITASLLVAAFAALPRSDLGKSFYYAVLVGFALACSIVIYDVQEHWMTSERIDDSLEFITPDFPGRISFPYTDQSLAVRSSFQRIPQGYGYYEQGITNPYADELFSVSSGYHNSGYTLLYLKAMHVGRLYVNLEEGQRDAITREKMNGTASFFQENERYGYFEIPLPNDGMAQAVRYSHAQAVQAKEPGCRELFQVHYCGSEREEFVTRDPDEVRYLSSYVSLLEEEYSPTTLFTEINPETFRIDIRGATPDTAIVVKMTYDDDFSATFLDSNFERQGFFSSHDGIPIERIGPSFMLLRPERAGNYSLELRYRTDSLALIGAFISLATVLILSIVFLYLYFSRSLSLRPNHHKTQEIQETQETIFPQGDMDE